jgi:hypothetical protein
VSHSLPDPAFFLIILTLIKILQRKTHTTDTLQTHSTDTHYRHTLQTHTTDTLYRHTLQTHYRHSTDTLQTHTTDTLQTHYRHTLQTHTTDTHYRHTLPTHTPQTHYRHTHTHYRRTLQTHSTDTHTHYRRTLQTHTSDTLYRHTTGTLYRHTTDTFLFISHSTNVLLFKFRCNIVIGVRIIKEMPGLVGSGTPCTLYEIRNTPRQIKFKYNMTFAYYLSQLHFCLPSKCEFGTILTQMQQHLYNSVLS